MFLSFNSMIPGEKVIYSDTGHLCILPWKSVWEKWVAISILNTSAKKWRQSCDLLKAIQNFSGKGVSRIQVYVYVPSKFFFQSFWNVCCGNSWRCGWFVTSVCLSVIFICLNFQRTICVCFFLVSLLEKAWNLVSVILLLWCPLSSLSCNFSIVQFQAVAIVLFLKREVLFSAVVRWMLARIVFWATVYVCSTWTSTKIKLLLTHTAVCTSPFKISPAAPRSTCVPLVFQKSFPRVSKYLK